MCLNNIHYKWGVKSAHELRSLYGMAAVYQNHLQDIEKGVRIKLVPNTSHTPIQSQ